MSGGGFGGGYGSQGFGGFQGFGQGGPMGFGRFNSYRPQTYNPGTENGQLGFSGNKFSSWAKPGFAPLPLNPYPSGQVPDPSQPQPNPSYPPPPAMPDKPVPGVPNPAPAPAPTQPPTFNPAPPQPTQPMQPGQNSWGWTADNSFTPVFNQQQQRYITHMTRGAYNGQTAPWLSQLDNNNMIASIGQLSGVQFDANDPRWR